MMRNRDLIKLLLDYDLDAIVCAWTSDGVREISNPTTTEGLPEWVREQNLVPPGAVILPV